MVPGFVPSSTRGPQILPLLSLFLSIRMQPLQLLISFRTGSLGGILIKFSRFSWRWTRRPSSASPWVCPGIRIALFGILIKKGIYSVKSGYQLALRDKFQGSSSCSSSNHRWWMSLWNLSIPPKIKIFIWRVCHDTLPSLLNLFKRKVGLDPSCKRCGKSPESTAHALFWCVNSWTSWTASSFGVLLVGFEVLSCFDILCWLSKNISRGDFEFVCVLLWFIWFERNCFFHSGLEKSGEEVFVASFLAEFHNTVKAVFVVPSVGQQLPSSAEVHSWIPPPAGSFKLNTDAAVWKDSPFVGVGAAICDGSGAVVAASPDVLLVSSLHTLGSSWLSEIVCSLLKSWG
ncbi:hypothetical protein ACOSQ2_029081 [Xanthoceras sorbifolium]